MLFHIRDSMADAIKDKARLKKAGYNVEVCLETQRRKRIKKRQILVYGTPIQADLSNFSAMIKEVNKEYGKDMRPNGSLFR